MIKQLFVVNRHSRDITQGEHSVRLQLFCVTRADSPKVSEGLMRPKSAAKTHFIELSDADTVFVSGDMLSNNIHCYLGEKKV